VRIGLISDTHIMQGMPGLDELPPKVKEVFNGVDLILHAGDVFSSWVLDELEEIAPVLTARGDDDTLYLNGRVKDKHILNLEGFCLHLCHSFPFSGLYPFLYPPWNCPADLSNDFDATLEEIIHQHDNIPDIIVFGDTHMVLVHRHPRLLLINPGSPALPDHRHMPGTVAILSISAGKAETDIIQL